MTDKEEIIIYDFDEVIEKSLDFVTSEVQGDICYIINKLKEHIKNKEQECEKWKEKWNIGFQKFCDKDDELQHYKQALDKIEKICNKSSKEWEVYIDETCTFHWKTRKTDRAKFANKILNIINKTKDGKND